VPALYVKQGVFAIVNGNLLTSLRAALVGGGELSKAGFASPDHGKNHDWLTFLMKKIVFTGQCPD
jgi:hypothetical protein